MQRFLSLLASLFVGSLVVAPSAFHAEHPSYESVVKAPAPLSTGQSDRERSPTRLTYWKRSTFRQKLMIASMVAVVCWVLVHHLGKHSKDLQEGRGNKSFVAKCGHSASSMHMAQVQLVILNVSEQVVHRSKSALAGNNPKVIPQTSRVSTDPSNTRPVVKTSDLRAQRKIVCKYLGLRKSDKIEPSWEGLLKFLQCDENMITTKRREHFRSVAQMIAKRMEALRISATKKHGKNEQKNTPKHGNLGPCTFGQAMDFYDLMVANHYVPRGFKRCVGKIGVEELSGLLAQNKNNSEHDHAHKIKEARSGLVDLGGREEILEKLVTARKDLANGRWKKLHVFFKDSPYCLLLLYKKEESFADAIARKFPKRSKVITFSGGQDRCINIDEAKRRVEIFEQVDTFYRLMRGTRYLPVSFRKFREAWLDEVEQAKKRVAKQLVEAYKKTSSKRDQKRIKALKGVLKVLFGRGADEAIKRVRFRLRDRRWQELFGFFDTNPYFLLLGYSEKECFAEAIARKHAKQVGYLRSSFDRLNKELKNGGKMPAGLIAGFCKLMQRVGYLPAKLEKYLKQLEPAAKSQKRSTIKAMGLQMEGVLAFLQRS